MFPFPKKINKGDVTKIIQFHKNNTNKINYKPFNSVNKDAKVLNKTFINKLQQCIKLMEHLELSFIPVTEIWFKRKKVQL